MSAVAPATSGTPVLPEDQLLELLAQLQRTTPEQARTILNAQPGIGFALFPLMVRVGIVDIEILQNTLSTHAETTQAAANASAQSHVPPVPPHVAQAQGAYSGQHSTPPPQSHTPSYSYGPSYGYPQNAQQQSQSQYPHHSQQQQQQTQFSSHTYSQQQQYQQQYNQYPPQQAPQQQQPQPALGALANIPEEQREMIMRVISMTPEQIARLPPQERAITQQLRATIGLPTE